MKTEIQTERVHRTWLNKLMLWRRAYETKISNDRLGVVGRGPTAHASEAAALRCWVEAYGKNVSAPSS
jgi:hypothetical protein